MRLFLVGIRDFSSANGRRQGDRVLAADKDEGNGELHFSVSIELEILIYVSTSPELDVATDD